MANRRRVATRSRSSSARALHGDLQLHEACRRIAVTLLKGLHRDARSTHPDRRGTVHTMRVTARRLRTVLGIIRPRAMKRMRKAIHGFDGALRQLNDRLAAVRDLDVLIADAERHLAARGGDHADLVLHRLRARRKRARHRLRRHLRGFIARAGSFAEIAAPPGSFAGGHGDGSHPAPRVRDGLPAVLWERHGAIRRFEAADRRDPHIAHALRREVRRLRFVLEFFTPVLGSAAKALAGSLVRIQDGLGALNDAVTAASTLDEAVAAKHLRRSALAGYPAQRRAEAAGGRAKAARMTAPLLSAAFRRRLEALLRPL